MPLASRLSVTIWPGFADVSSESFYPSFASFISSITTEMLTVDVDVFTFCKDYRQQ